MRLPYWTLKAPTHTRSRNQRHKFDARFWSACHTILRQIFTGASFWSRIEHRSISVPETGTNSLLYWLTNLLTFSTSTVWDFWIWGSTCLGFRKKHKRPSATNSQQTCRQEFLGSRSSTVERSSTRTAAARTFLRFFQTIFENTSLWRLKRLVTLSTYRRYINKCIYLSTYL